VITEKDLQEAIAECKGQRNPNASTCIKLAAFYTILDHMYGDDQKEFQSYSFAPIPTQNSMVEYDGTSDFAKRIHDKDSSEMWKLMDDLMDTLSIVNPKLYSSIMARISD
jgi:hypothetical protein